jgi:hypothetical protein
MSLADVFARLDRSRAELRGTLDVVPFQLRQHRPGTDRWSIAEVVEHLALVDEWYLSIIGDAIAEARRTRVAVEEAEADQAVLPPPIEAMVADRTERRNAPESVRPTGIDFDTAWGKAETARTAFRAALSSVHDVALSRVRFEHRRFGTLNALQCGVFLAAHESRHVAQIREIAAQLNATEHAAD